MGWSMFWTTIAFSQAMHGEKERDTHLRREQVSSNLPAHDGHHEFMYETREQKGKEHGRRPTQSPRGDRGCVDVAQEEIVYGLVPFTRKDVHGGRVPPVEVEFPVGEAVGFTGGLRSGADMSCQSRARTFELECKGNRRLPSEFGKCITDAFEHDVKDEQVVDHHR